MRLSGRLLAVAALASGLSACAITGGGTTPTSPTTVTTSTPTPALPVATASVVASSRTPLAAFDAIQFDGTSTPATLKTTVKDLTGNWQAQFNVQTRTYALQQTGTQVYGNYLNSSNGGQVWSLSVSFSGASRLISLTATYPGESTVRLTNAVLSEDASSFSGITSGGSANGAFLTYTR